MSKHNNPQKEFDRLERIIAAQQAQQIRTWDFLTAIKLVANQETSQAISAFMTRENLGRNLINGGDLQ